MKIVQCSLVSAALLALVACEGQETHAAPSTATDPQPVTAAPVERVPAPVNELVAEPVSEPVAEPVTPQPVGGGAQPAPEDASAAVGDEPSAAYQALSRGEARVETLRERVDSLRRTVDGLGDAATQEQKDAATALVAQLAVVTAKLEELRNCGEADPKEQEASLDEAADSLEGAANELAATLP